MNINDYHNIDKELNNLSLYYEDIDISYIIRNHLISQIRNKTKNGNPEIKLNRKILLRLFKSIFITFSNIFAKNKIWVFSNAERRKSIDNIYYDRVASIVSEVHNDVLFIENPVIVNHKKRKDTIDKILSESIFFLLSFLVGFFFFRKQNLKLDTRLLDIEAKYYIKLNIDPLIKRFVGQYYFMNFYIKYISKPQKVFSVYPNGYYGYNFAFKKQGIPVIELQHGIIYPSHPSYNTTLYSKSRMFKPDYIFTYGAKDKECLEKMNYIKGDNIFVVGSYGLWKSKNSKLPISDYLNTFKGNSSKLIVFIATTNDIYELYNLALQLEKKSNQLKILILPRHQIQGLQNTTNVKVLNITKTNIFECYKIADFLLTKSSTSALESLFMDIPTFIFESNETSIFKINFPFIESFNYVNSIDQLNFMLSNSNFIKPSPEDVGKVYASNIIQNFTKENKNL